MNPNAGTHRTRSLRTFIEGLILQNSFDSVLALLSALAEKPCGGGGPHMDESDLFVPKALTKIGNYLQIVSLLDRVS